MNCCKLCISPPGGTEVERVVTRNISSYVSLICIYCTSFTSGEQGSHLLAAGRVRSKKRKRKTRTRSPAAPKTNHELHSSPATATTSERSATKHVPRVGPYAPASVDPEFVDNLPPTAPAITKNDECYTYTDRQTARQTN